MLIRSTASASVPATAAVESPTATNSRDTVDDAITLARTTTP
jgi:hypothetical protein